MKRQSCIVAVLSGVAIAISNVGAARAQENPPTDQNPIEGMQVVVEEPTVVVTNQWEWVQMSPDGDMQYLPTTRVTAHESISARSIVRGETTDAPETVQTGGYSMTMERWLTGSPTYSVIGTYNGWVVSGGGSTRTNVTAAELLVRGQVFWGSPGHCNSGVYWYQPANATNTTYHAAQTPGVIFAIGQEHCIKNAQHGAKFPGFNYWHWYLTRSGPNHVF